jgi:hypothetical protein
MWIPGDNSSIGIRPLSFRNFGTAPAIYKKKLGIKVQYSGINEVFRAKYTNNKYPDSFFIPPLEIRKSVELGMSVKVIADWMNYEDSDERFWVELKEERIDENGARIFFGESRNNTKVIKWGTKFGPIRLRNICDINFEEFENRNSKLVNA